MSKTVKKLSGIPSVLDDITRAMECLKMGHEFTSMNDVETCNRYAIAIRSLGQHVLGLVESMYEPEEHTYLFRGHVRTPEKWEVKATSEEEAMKKFPSVAGEGATWFSVEEGKEVGDARA